MIQAPKLKCIKYIDYDVLIRFLITKGFTRYETDEFYYSLPWDGGSGGIYCTYYDSNEYNDILNEDLVRIVQCIKDNIKLDKFLLITGL